MSDQSTLDGLGLSDDMDMIWTRTHEAIARRGYKIKRPPGGTSAELGEGMFATVFYAEHIQDKTPVAIKVFRDDDADKVASFKREAETLRAPDFPRQFAITAYDVWHEPDAQPFIVMEFIRGQPIHEYCERQSLDQPRRIELIEQALRGLQELHHRNIQHRDISVANILIDDQGRVRYLDFGLAGEIIRATRHTTIDARGNRAYSPAEVVKGDKKADAKDDIFACGMLAVHILAGDAPPENVTQSGDPEHIARCKRQLSERGVSAKLTGIVLHGLKKPEHRYSQPDAMADALFDYRVRRPRRIRTFRIAMAMVFVVMCLGALGWWRYDQRQRDSAFRKYAELKEQTEDLPYAKHEAVAGRLEQAEQLREQWKRQFDTGQREEAMATLAREMTLLHEALHISRGLKRCLPRLEALGIPLNENPWVDQSSLIVERRTELSRQYQDVTAMLNEGRIDDAWQAIDALQVTLAELIRDNAEAGKAATIRSQYDALATSVCERLQAEDEFAAFGKLAEPAEKAWTSGDWKQTDMLFGQAVQELSEWLEANETPEERTARTKAIEERIAALEAERDQHAQRVKELEKRIAESTKDPRKAVGDSATTRESPKQDTQADATRPSTPERLWTAPKVKVFATRRNSLGMEFIRIPAGKYQRGAAEGETGAADDEKPRHWVQITNDFYVGKFEVTQAIYEKVMGVNPSYFSWTGEGSEEVRGVDTRNFPVETVSCFDAIEFLNRLSALDGRQPYYELTDVQRSGITIVSATVKILGGNGYRLLTEAEWEYVARAGTTTVFPWGDALSSTQANFDGNYPYGGTAKGPNLGRTTAVGSYPANPWGLCDTAGNVWEWVWDWHDVNTYKQYAATTAVDPTGPRSGDLRVRRGGGWNDPGGEFCRPARRAGNAPVRRYSILGFRVAHSLSSENEAADRSQVPQANATQPRPEPPAPALPPAAPNVNTLPTKKNSLGMEFIRIPAGTYQRGASEGETGSGDDEEPRHWVQITNDFYVDKFKVTQAMYQKVMGVNPSYFSSTGSARDRVRGMDTTNFPVENVSWFDAIAFCINLNALENRQPYYELTDVERSGETITGATVKILGGDGYRLLTEAEWEYVARAGTTTIFPWGDSLSSTQANFDGTYPYGGAAKGPNLQRTTAVGSYPANRWGLYDMAGNVQEWVWDRYDEDEYERFAEETAVDPSGPPTGESRVYRGSSWSLRGKYCRLTNRRSSLPRGRFVSLGFRVAHGLSSE